ncbi:MAG: hypothetical protein PHS82_03280 [Lachnospiraceae bacterium]|nr:hypothetical protein [Lachnospiraceae bacterium]
MAQNFKYGQLLISRKEMKVQKALSEEEEILPIGNKVVIGFDGLAHHLQNGMIQPMAKDCVIAGHSSTGIVEALYGYLRTWLPLSDMMEAYDVTEDEFKEKCIEALEEIGLYE